jgi:hypothetical protein
MSILGMLRYAYGGHSRAQKVFLLGQQETMNPNGEWHQLKPQRGYLP